METSIKLACHNHILNPSSGFAFRCYWCKTGGYISNGYHCTTCDLWLHKDCVNLKFSWEINHTSHFEHLLKLTKLNNFSKIFLCRKCLKLIEDDWAYDCFTCSDFNLHASCAIEQPPLTIKHPQAHAHPLVLFRVTPSRHVCEICKEDVASWYAYWCFKCNVAIHFKCINSSEVNHPCHPKHFLKLIIDEGPDYLIYTCTLCGMELWDVPYHCSICNFNVCFICASIPPPINVEHLKTHEHKLTLMAREISFICNACGMQGNGCPYFCLECYFMIHRSCIGLPRVININRHDHRISHTQQLSFGDWVCKVCLQNVNRFYGAYTCSVCINYVVHSQCATRKDVWDGIELEGIPEETEDLKPFKEVGDDLINHFSHEKHSLKLNKGWTNHGGNIRCEACMLSVNCDSVYTCEQCNFTLHEMCANLPRKKQHMFHNKPLTLHVDVGEMESPKILSCSACGKFFNGFRYVSDHVVLDIKCTMISEFFYTEQHEHPLHYNETTTYKCDACQEYKKSRSFSCRSCDYDLDFRCASLPKTVKYIDDPHPLSLSCKENASVQCWCDICEMEVEPNKWVYICNDCEIAMHVKCVLEGFSHLKPGKVLEFKQVRFVVIPNNHSSRPYCGVCRRRCMAPFFVKSCNLNLSICSQRCFYDVVFLSFGQYEK